MPASIYGVPIYLAEPIVCFVGHRHGVRTRWCADARRRVGLCRCEAKAHATDRGRNPGIILFVMQCFSG
jgi:hypothetical protein